MTKPISQREARALRRRVQELEDTIDRQRNAWATDWPNGTHLGSVNYGAPNVLVAAARTARRLGHAVVVTCNDDNQMELYALPLGSKA
jgi:hypothetical protein